MQTFIREDDSDAQKDDSDAQKDDSDAQKDDSDAQKDNSDAKFCFTMCLDKAENTDQDNELEKN